MPAEPLADFIVDLPGHDLRPAFIEGATGRVLTWSDVKQTARDWRDRAPELVARGERVGIAAADPLAKVASLLGCFAAGLAVVPLDSHATAAELAHTAELLGLGVVVADVEARDQISSLEGTRRCLAIDPDGRLEGVLAEGPWYPVDTSPEIRLILSSSGTTGTPKIVGLSGEQLLVAAGAVAQHHHLTPEDRGYCPLPLSHINAIVVGVLSTIVGGGSLVVDRRFSASRYWSTVERCEVTWLNAVPALLAALGTAPAPAPSVSSRIRFARSASSPLSPSTLHRFEDNCHVRVLETYGMTEASGQITANPLDPDQRRVGSVGMPVGLTLRVAGGERRGEVAPGEIGEIEIAGPSVVSRYLAPNGHGWGPSVTDQAGWLRTADLGFRDEDGFVHLVGRQDDVINRGGEKVYPSEIEDVLLGDDRVAVAAVTSRPHPLFGEEPVAFVLKGRRSVTNDLDSAELVADLRRRCDARLSRYKRPAEIVVVADLPVGATGKVRRAELRRRAAASDHPMPSLLERIA